MFTSMQLDRVLYFSLHEPLLRLGASSPMAHAFSCDAQAINEPTLLRHSIEHIFRIRMFRRLDAAASLELQCSYPQVADMWGQYARSESVHDRYFLRDVCAAGLDPENLETLQQFPATSRLGIFIGEAMRLYGALPVVLYSFWAEHGSMAGTPRIVARNKAVFGDKAIKGVTAHLALDDNQGHPALITEILKVIISNEKDLFLASTLLEQITDMIGDYFSELGNWSKQLEAEELLAQLASNRRKREIEAITAVSP